MHSAGAIKGSVGIIGFWIKSTIVHHPLKSIVHVTSIAAVVGGVAVDELLHGEGNQVASGYGIHGFDGASGGECPIAP